MAKLGLPKLGYLFGGPYNKDLRIYKGLGYRGLAFRVSSILGAILRSPYLGKLPYLMSLAVSVFLHA